MFTHNAIRNLLVTVALVVCYRPVFAQEKKSDPPERTLDEQLLDDLDSDLLDELELLPEKRPDDSRDSVSPIPVPKDDAQETHENDDTQDDANLEPGSAGEDIELGQSSDPLTRIGRRMRTAKNLIDRSNTSKQTQQLQEEILDDLAALIARLQSQQMPQDNGGESSGGRFQAGEGSGATGEESVQGPEQSTDRVGQADTTLSALRRQQELLRRMNWGSLPDRLRDQVRSSRVEQFLPKYARLIEQYYKRLAEESPYQP